jgi:hypothetical protein
LQAQDGKQEDETTREGGPTTVEQLASLATTLEGVRDKKQDTVEDNAGEIEAAILSAAAMRRAAGLICAGIPKSNNVDNITSLYFVTDADLQRARRAGVLLTQIDVMSSFLQGYRRSDRVDTAIETGSTRGFIPALGAASQLLSALLRNDDTVSGISGTLTDSTILANMMIDQQASGGQCHNAVPLTFTQDVIGDSSSTSLVLGKINNLNLAYQAFLATIAKEPTESETEIKTGYENFMTGLTTSVDGTSAIESLIRASGVWRNLSSDPGVGVLRLSVDKSGGTLLQRKNIWTALGARSLAITAGIVVSYRISTSVGTAKAGGTVYCTTAQTSFVDLHKMAAENIPAHCSGESTAPKSKT